MKNPLSQPNAQSMTVQEALTIAVGYFQEGNLTDSKIICNKILSVNTENSDCYTLLGNIEAQQGQYQNAIVFFNQAISLKKDFSYFYNLGNCFKALHQLNNSIENYRSAIRINPNFPILYFHLGMALREQGKYKEATEIFRNWVNLNPSNPESLINLGSILAEQNENDEAIEYYEKVLALEPTHQSALYSLASVLANQSRMNEAKYIFDKLLHSHPTDALKIKAVWQIPIIATST